MITTITLENFKCFRRVSINPKLLTVLIGPNGTGKSSVLQALLLLKQSAETDCILLKGDCITFSDANDVISNFASGEMVARFAVCVSSASDPVSEIDINKLTFSAECTNNLQLFSPGETGTSTQTGVQSQSAPVGRVLRQLAFVPAIRGFSQPKYQLGEKRNQQVPSHLGYGEQEERLATNLVYSRENEGLLSHLMKRVTGTGIRADMAPNHLVEVKSVTKTGAVNMVAEGFGANSLIQLFHQLIIAEKGSTVLIEEPEIHLHPKAQADLAEVLAETAKAEDKQVIMTTHSEYVAGRLLTLVAEGKLTPNELAIYSFEKDIEGECTAAEIEITERGQVKGGLTGFHEATRDEMRRYADGLRNNA